MSIRENYLTVNELCDWLKVRPATVYRWIHIHYGIPVVRTGTLLRFPESKVQAWLEEKGDSILNSAT